MTKTEERLVNEIADRLFGKIKAYLDERFDVPDELLTSEEPQHFLNVRPTRYTETQSAYHAVRM